MNDKAMKLKISELDLPRTIFALIDEYRMVALKKALEDWASKSNCQVHWGDQLNLNILNLSAFVTIIDRRLLSARFYDYYLQWCDGLLDIKIVEETIAHSNRTREVVYRTEELMFVEQPQIEDKEFCDDVCIFIDNLIEIQLPRTKLVHVINPDEPRFTDWVVNITQMAHKSVFERVYKTAIR